MSTAQTQMASSGARSPRWALAALAMAMLLSSLGTSIANVALPALTEAFGASFQAVQWVVIAYLLAITTLVVSAGRLGDIVGRRRLLVTGLVVFTVASLLCGLAPTLPLLIAARAAQGLGAAFMMALTMAFVGDLVPKEKTGRAMGLLGTMSAIGTALGPSLGGFLIAVSGWQAIFLAIAPFGLVTSYLAFRTLPAVRPQPQEARARFDVAGTALLALSLAAYALAVTLGRGDFGLLNGGLLLGAAIGTALFVRAEATASSPLIRLPMLRDRALSAGLTVSALVSSVMMTTLVVGPFYLARGLGLGAAMVGLIMSVGPAVVALSGVPAGRLADRYGARRMTFGGLIAMAASAVLLAVLPTSFNVAGYVGPLVIVTAGYALFQTANNTAVMGDVDAGQRGLVSGMLNLSRNLGLVSGASAMGAVFALAAGTADMTTAQPAAVATGMRITFGVAAVLIAAALVAVRLSRRPSQGGGNAP